MTGWTFVGPRLLQPRPSWTAAVLAFMFAWQVMTDVPPQYPSYMVLFAFVGAAYCLRAGVQAHAWASLLFVPVVLLWLNPLFGMTWFAEQGVVFFLAHSALAMLFAIAAYTYMAREKHA